MYKTWIQTLERRASRNEVADLATYATQHTSLLIAYATYATFGSKHSNVARRASRNEVAYVANEAAYVAYAMSSIRSEWLPCTVVRCDASLGQVRES